MSDKPITIKMRGTAGQSLGVWNAGGLHLALGGDATDFVGKGMAGGRIVPQPAKNVRYATRAAAIIGYTQLSGTTAPTTTRNAPARPRPSPSLYQSALPPDPQKNP